MGEIHVLDVTRTRCSADGYEVVLRPCVGFLSKTYVTSNPPTALTRFRIRSLAKGLDKSERDRKLCPVKVLRYYMKRTEPLRAGNKTLFFPLRRSSSKGRLSPNMISGWLKQCIRLVHEVTGKDEDLMRLHSI